MKTSIKLESRIKEKDTAHRAGIFSGALLEAENRKYIVFGRNTDVEKYINNSHEKYCHVEDELAIDQGYTVYNKCDYCIDKNLECGVIVKEYISNVENKGIKENIERIFSENPCANIVGLMKISCK